MLLRYSLPATALLTILALAPALQAQDTPAATDKSALKAEHKQQKAQEKAANANAKAAKQQAKAKKQDNKAQRANEKAQQESSSVSR